MRRVIITVGLLLALLPALASAQGWRGAVNGQGVFSGTTARPQTNDTASLGSASIEWLGLYVKNVYFGAGGVALTSDAADTLAQRNGANPQTFRIYNTYTDIGNYERLAIDWAGGSASVKTGQGGSGSARSLTLGTNGAAALNFVTQNLARWSVASTGELLAGLDNSLDIGASGATRPRTAYIGTSVVTPTVNATTAYQNAGVPQIYFTTGNFTTAANTSLQTITGLTIPLPLNTVLNVPFSCKLTYSMATAAVAMSFGLQTDTLTPTNFQGMGQMETALTTTAYGDAKVTNTTATAIVTGTPSAITTIWNAYVDGFVENPSGAATNINVMVATSNAGDLVTVYRDSWCRAF